MEAGKFIVVEGGEGVGKSTNLRFIHQYLERQGIDFISTREPGGTPLAEEIREILLRKREEPVAAMAELLLVFAARAQHVEQVILPALKRGQWVVGDRFIDASYVYQGAGRDLGYDQVAILEQLVLQDFRADLVIVLDVDLSISQARARERGALDRFEEESLKFHEKVRNAYLHRANSDPWRYKVINAGQTLECMQRDLEGVIAEQFNLPSVAASTNTVQPAPQTDANGETLT